VRTQQWKLVHPTGFLNETPSQAVPFELYDMSSDPKEQRNLAELRLDVYRRLYDAYHNWFADVSSTRPDNFAAPRIVIGSHRETTTVLTRQDWRDSDSARYGKWLLRAERDAEYDVELRWLKPVTAGTVEITAGAFVRTMELSEPVDRVRFDRIRIPSGDLEFTAVLRRANVTDGPYQATLAQVAADR
jgi:hypothetical protein